MNLNHFSTLAFSLILLMAACNSYAGDANLAAGVSSAVEVEKTTAQKAEPLVVEFGQSDESMIKDGEVVSGDRVQLHWPDGEVQLDKQGSVEVAVTPLNLNDDGLTLEFEVGLNTHSVDLSMDLTSIARLKADNGLGVRAVLWVAPRGGHHVSGVLSFPAVVDGVKLLEDASRLTMTIRDLDALDRSFTWNLPG
jgi:hypothetical protein